MLTRISLIYLCSIGGKSGYSNTCHSSSPDEKYGTLRVPCGVGRLERMHAEASRGWLSWGLEFLQYPRLIECVLSALDAAHVMCRSM